MLWVKPFYITPGQGEERRIKMGQIKMFEKVAARCLDRIAYSAIALERVNIVSVRWDTAASVFLVN